MKAAIYSFMKFETIVIDLLQISMMKKFDLINLLYWNVKLSVQLYMHEDIFTPIQRLVLRKLIQKQIRKHIPCIGNISKIVKSLICQSLEIFQSN